MGKKHGTLTKAGKVSPHPPNPPESHHSLGQEINAKSQKEMWGRINQEKS